MIRASTFAGKQIAVFGLGASGVATARSLIDGGADVAAWDDGEAARESAYASGVPLVDLAAADWAMYDALVLAPGVPLTHPKPHWTVEKARAADVEIIGDIEIFARERASVCANAPLIAITGTNGKSTTTALIAHMLRVLGLDVQVGGNIGKAVLTLEPPAENRIHVIELSSFQIDLSPSFSASSGVLLNVTPDHLDRHGTIENYAAIKERMVTQAQAKCVCLDDGYTKAVAQRLEGDEWFYPFTAGKGAAIVPRFYAIGLTLFLHTSEKGGARSDEIGSLEGIGSLRGPHNVQNALAALSAILALQDLADAGLAALGSRIWVRDGLIEGLRTFAGLQHRMEEVGRSGRVVFVNDSKATNVDSAAKALSAFDRDIFWIAGGKAKDGGIDALAPYFPRIRKAYLIGEAAALFAETLSGKVDHVDASDMDRAVGLAAADAMACSGEHPVVMLSPACASYDQFRNFELRGDAFREAVAKVGGITMTGGGRL